MGGHAKGCLWIAAESSAGSALRGPPLSAFTQACDTRQVPKDVSDEDTIQQVVERLQAKFPGMPREEIETAARAEFDEFTGRPVKDYLAILVERSTKKKLKKSADAKD